MVPPGLSYVSVSERAVAKAKAGRHGCYYFDLLKALASAEKGDTPWTPAISLVLALRQALRMMREEGIENVIARHAANAGAVRAAVTALGLDLLSSSPSNATTAVCPPEGMAAEIIAAMERDYGVKIAGGQARLKGRIFRLGHLGYYHPSDMYAMIAALEGALADLGIIEQTGVGLNALRWSYSQGKK
jgi:aspartate aminotransferase-like enzyme